jgi:glutamyl-tRNA synthetase
MGKVRTRFAPSPTGFLHLGGARTALFNALFAAHHGGAFVLRIEDTDKQRSERRFVDAILDDLSWLGLNADEGPFFQSERSELYRDKVSALLEGGHAYHCFCSPETIEEKRQRAQAQGKRAVYDGTCRDLGRVPGDREASVVRFRSPADGQTLVDDMVRGTVSFENSELDDLILVRSDGSPTFHLVVVVDDIEMGITHILRGEDHLTNTAKQIPIFRALGDEPPKYGHLPLIVGSDRARLSKRHGATAVDAYRDQGFLPGAVVNYLARLGWAHGDQEIFTRDELVSAFDVDGVGKAAAAFDMEKFTWVNTQHMKAMDDDALAHAVEPYLFAVGIEGASLERIAQVVPLLKERAKTLVELAEQMRAFLSDDIVFDAKAVGKFLGEAQCDLVDEVAAALEDAEPWSHDGIKSAFEAVMAAKELKLGKLAQPVRVALVGGSVSPGIFEVCEVLGRETTVARLRGASAGARRGDLPVATAD